MGILEKAKTLELIAGIDRKPFDSHHTSVTHQLEKGYSSIFALAGLHMQST